MTETTFLVEWSELKNSEADLIIFRVGNELAPPTQHLLNKFRDAMKHLFKENKITIPFTVLAKAVVEVEAVVKKKENKKDEPFDETKKELGEQSFG